MAIQTFADGSQLDTSTNTVVRGATNQTTTSSGGGGFSAPQPPVGSFVNNPGGVWQTYNPKTGVTNYGTPPSWASSNAGAIPGQNNFTYGGTPMAVATPTGTPYGASVYQGAGLGYAQANPMTMFTSKGTDANGKEIINSEYAQDPTGLASYATNPTTYNSAATPPSLTVPPALGAGTAGVKQYQIINTDAMKQYSSSQYQRLSDGRVVLNPGINPIPGTVKETSFTLPPTQAPSSAGSVVPSSSVNLSTTVAASPNVADAISDLAGIKTGIESADKAIEEYAKLKMGWMQQMQTSVTPFLQKFLGAKTSQQTFDEALVASGINERAYYADQRSKVAEIESLNNKYSQLQADKDAQVAALTNRPGSTRNFLNAQVNQIERVATPELNRIAANINAKTATLQSLQGNYQTAIARASTAANLAAADQKMAYDQYKTFYDLNKDQFDALDSVYKEAYTFQMNKALTDYQQTLADKETIGKLIVSNPKAGISITDDLSSAYKKFSAAGGDISNNSFSMQIDPITGTPYIYNTKTGQIAGGSGFPTSQTGGKMIATSTGQTYDLSTYATDQQHANSIQNILNNIGQFKSAQDVTNYIKSVAPNSPITAKMIQDASAKYGIGWEEQVALLQQESQLGTAGKGARLYNPGNVGNTDSGAEVNYGSWQAGVDAAAKQLARRKTTGSSTPTSYQDTGNTTIDTWAKAALTDPKTLDNLTTAQAGAVVATLANQGLSLPSPTDFTPPTSSEFISAGYAMRMDNSLKIMDELSTDIAKYAQSNPLQYSAYRSMYANDITRGFVPQVIQQELQAESDFINSLLRKESGAVINNSEFVRYGKQYFPLPGDSEAVLKAKKLDREIALKGVANAAGSAATTYGTQTTTPNNISSTATNELNSIISSVATPIASNSSNSNSNNNANALKTGGFIGWITNLFKKK